MNATVLAEDVGVAVKPVVDPVKGIVMREEIKRVMSMVIEGEEGVAMRRRARQLKECAAKALNDRGSGGGGSSYASLARVVKEWKGN